MSNCRNTIQPLHSEIYSQLSTGINTSVIDNSHTWIAGPRLSSARSKEWQNVGYQVQLITWWRISQEIHPLSFNVTWEKGSLPLMLHLMLNKAHEEMWQTCPGDSWGNCKVYPMRQITLTGERDTFSGLDLMICSHPCRRIALNINHSFWCYKLLRVDIFGKAMGEPYWVWHDPPSHWSGRNHNH